ncbi:hypothetical protein [Stutzerimonas nitrititolerans]|uniref:hypothetical protein n=1 Tax=Stutzerimonas nitrititolerans TaxID=2482751 RepID=UPI0014823876|nr:hypothetical protein [Stutzerimonas nitrititolerans]NNT92292.1 hypothetical protein [Stutzerimonas nitrititolerans]
MLSVSISSGWRRAVRADRRAAALPWDALQSLDRPGSVRWKIAGPADSRTATAPWSRVSTRDVGTVGAWQPASPQDRPADAMPWADVPVKDAWLSSGWNHSIRPADIRLRLIYNPKPARKDTTVAAGHRRVNEFGPRYNAATALQDSLYVPGSGALVFEFGGRPYFPSTSPSVFFDFRYVPATPAIQPTDMRPAKVRWQSARRLSLSSTLPWGRARQVDGVLTDMPYVDYPGPVKPLPEPPPDPEILDTYMIANTVNLVVLPSRTPIEAKNVRVALDADSFSWSFSADIFTQAALDLVRPDAGGAKTVELDINGWKWVVLVERYSRQLRFPTEAYSINGATRPQLLAAPYAPLRTSLNSGPINAGQAAEAELLNTGFTLAWQATDWTLPAGAFSYQSQTAMQVIARLAETVGGVVRPARDADALEVVPRYPAAPWAWDDVDTPISRIIPPAMMTELGGEWTPQPAWNACYTSGTSHGVSMLVRRAGTAGDNPTPDVFEDWLTDQPANQARGIHELSKGGNIEIVSFTIPLFPFADDHGVGLVLPAQLCRVPESSGAWVGLCLAVDISAEGTGAVRVKQQIKLERHH